MSPSDEQMGQPIRILRDQEYEPSTDFIARVRRRIHRRTATSQVASYSWHMPKMILIEMISVIEHLLQAFGTSKEPRR